MSRNVSAHAFGAASSRGHTASPAGWPVQRGGGAETWCQCHGAKEPQSCATRAREQGRRYHQLPARPRRSPGPVACARGGQVRGDPASPIACWAPSWASPTCVPRVPVPIRWWMLAHRVIGLRVGPPLARARHLNAAARAPKKYDPTGVLNARCVGSTLSGRSPSIFGVVRGD